MNSRRHPRCSFAAEELAAIFLAQATLSNCALRSSGSIFRKWTMSSSNATVPALFQASKRLRVDAGMSAGCIQPGEPSSESQDEVMKSSVLVEKTSGVGGFPVKTPDLYPLPGFEPPPLPQGSQHDSELAIKASEEAVSSQVEPAELTLEQKMRMETNKTIAQAKRNIRACQLHIAEAKKAGKFPGFAELLVEQSWADVLHGEFSKPYMRKLHLFVEQEVSGKFPVYPPLHLVFNAFNTCPFGKVKVVIIGQDPYHGPGQAMGLSFSVPQGTKIPSSLVNIFKEIRDDVGSTIPSHGNLEKWAHQGVLMLNAVLTVRERHANSHSKKGWEPFTDAAIRLVSQKRKGVVFLLWGNSACDKIRLIDTTQHHILKTAHPSGLSAHKGFFSCRHFSKANEILVKAGRLPIDWQL